jgi:hypothetical protein
MCLVAFRCGFTTDAMLAALLAYGDAKAAFLDSTFATNQYMVRNIFFLCMFPTCSL